MADLTDAQSAQTVKIVGSDTSGVENNFLNVDVSGALLLPSGASTNTLQTVGNSILTSVDNKLTSTSTNPNSISQTALIVRTIPYLPPTFTILADSIILGNNKSMFALYNNASNKIVTLQSIRLVNTQTTAVTGVVTTFNLKRITGLSGGTTITPESYDTSDTLPLGITSSTNGTVSGEASGTLLKQKWSSDEWGTGTLDVEAGNHSNQQLGHAWLKIDGCKGIMLRTGEGVTLKCVTNTTAGSFDFEIVFTVGDV